MSTVVIGVWAAQTSDALLIKPGPMFPVASTVELATVEPGDTLTGQVAFPTAAASSVSRFTELRCAITGSCHTRTLEVVDPKKASDPAVESLTFADDAATLLAAGRVQDYPSSGWPHAPGTLTRMPGIQGPSAGLAVALHLLDVRTTGDLVAGKKVAATGTIDSSGAVGMVGEVPYKLESVQDWNADVFFVPVGSSSGLPDTSMPVVEVSSLTEATAWLCEHGGSGSLCNADPNRS